MPETSAVRSADTRCRPVCLNRISTFLMSVFLAYLSHNGKVWPQKWYGDQTKGTGQFQYKSVGEDEALVGFHILTPEQEHLSLDELTRLIPYDRPSQTTTTE